MNLFVARRLYYGTSGYFKKMGYRIPSIIKDKIHNVKVDKHRYTIVICTIFKL